MHDLIGDMELQIHEDNPQTMVKAGAWLKELPDAEEWRENLVRISLMQIQIKEIPSSQSPKCPNLSTLLLHSNRLLRFIANSFFKQLHGLKVLNLSDTCIKKLPDSVSDLVGLTALLLKGCNRLRHVTSLKKLRALKRLDLSNTALANMPRDMVCLSKLKFLRLHGCGQKEFPTEILLKFSHLQVFLLEEWMPIKHGWRQYAPVTVKGKEVPCLRKLETMECHFEHFCDFAEYLKSRDETQALSIYKFFVGQLDENDYDRMTLNSHRSKTVGLGNFCISKNLDFLLFPSDIVELIIYRCNDVRSLCDVSSLIKYATELELIYVEDCNSMESLLSSSWFSSDPLPWPSNGIFSGLKEFYCYGCTSMKKLFPLVLLPNLVNLEVIEVGGCYKVEEIIAKRDDEGMGEESSSSSYYSITEFNLPKLRTLRLDYLPKLTSVCSAKLIFHSLEEIVVRECPKLKRIPVSLPLLENGSPSAPLS